MKKRIVYTRPDGGLSVLIPAPESRRKILVTAAVYKAAVVGYRVTGKLDATGKSIVEDLTEQQLVSPAVYRDETDDEFLDRVRATDVPADATAVHVCTVADIPADRTFRDAWERHPTQAVSVNMPKARTIHLSRVRAARNAALDSMDAANVTALRRVAAGVGTEAEKQSVVKLEAQKQALRDLPASVSGKLEAATTPDELKATWPKELPPAI